MFRDARNKFDFWFRNFTKFSRKNFNEKKQQLIERNINENLYLEDILEQSFIKTKKENLHILDIGSKNWFYVKGEYKYFKNFCNNFRLDGIEIDAHRLYNNLYSRYEVAKFHMKNLNNTNYICDNLLNLNNKYDYIIWILPFIFKEPHMYWGLPKNLFYPEKLLEHAYKLLKSNGQLLIINQGILEAKEQKRFLKKLAIKYKYLGKISSRHFSYNNKRYGFLITKE